MSTINYTGLKSFDGKVTEDEFNRLVDALQTATLMPGVNYRILRTPAGTTIQTESGDGGIAQACPFTVALAAIPDSGNLKVKISPGTVNQLVPGNLFDDFTVTKTGTFYVKAGVETDGQAVTSVTIYVDGSEPDAQTPVPFALPSSFDVLIALIKDGKAYRTIACGSIELTGNEEFRTDKSPPAEPGELTYIPYFRWVYKQA